MNKTEVMKQLKALGTEQTRKTYARHGVTGECFGVRYGDLYKLVKKIGVDQKLADQLWAAKNHDARTVAAMIADPTKMTATALDSWVKTVNNQLGVDAVASLATKTPHALGCAKKWIASKSEWVAATGWHVVAGGCCGRPGEAAAEIADQPDSFFENLLKKIEKSIHASPNRVKHSMNGALIGIGIRNPALRKKALATAKRIGKVEVDHGDTSCKTPDATSYIEKVASQRSEKTTKKKASSRKRPTKKVARARA